FTEYQSAVGDLQSFPPFITVHGIIPSNNRSDLSGIALCHFTLHMIEEFQSRGREYVTAIEKRVKVYLFHTLTLRHFQQSDDMIDMTMNTAVGQKPHKVERFFLFFHIIHGCKQHLI